MQTGFKLFLTIFLITLSGLFGQEGGPPMLTDDARVADYKEWDSILHLIYQLLKTIQFYLFRILI